MIGPIIRESIIGRKGKCLGRTIIASWATSDETKPDKSGISKEEEKDETSMMRARPPGSTTIQMMKPLACPARQPDASDFKHTTDLDCEPNRKPLWRGTLTAVVPIF
jgi:hypothetical protein